MIALRSVRKNDLHYNTSASATAAIVYTQTRIIFIQNLYFVYYFCYCFRLGVYFRVCAT